MAIYFRDEVDGEPLQCPGGKVRSLIISFLLYVFFVHLFILFCFFSSDIITILILRGKNGS